MPNNEQLEKELNTLREQVRKNKNKILNDLDSGIDNVKTSKYSLHINNSEFMNVTVEYLKSIGKTDADILTWYKAEKIKKVKEEAGKKILAILPEWKQRNLIARSAELLDKKISGTITPDEQTELNNLQTQWNSINTIRNKSNTVETTINGLATIDEVESFDISSNL